MTVEKAMTDEARDRLMNQLIRLGDMMGDGLHHEPDGKWIEREYASVMRQLYPEIYREKAQKANVKRDAHMTKVLADKKCPCGGALKQTRKGAFTCKCVECDQKFKLTKSKK